MRPVLLILVVSVLAVAGPVIPALGEDTGCEGIIYVDDEPVVVDEIQQAIDNVCPGGTVMVAPGDYQGAVLTKPVNIVGSGNSTRIVSGTPAFWDLAGFFIDAGSHANGSLITNLAIENDPDIGPYGFSLGVLGRAADDITITHLEITNTAQGITNGNGDRWTITHNTIHGFAAPWSEDHLLGIGVWSDGSRYGVEIGAVYDNFIAFNEIVADYQGDHQFLLTGIDIGQWPPEVPAPLQNTTVEHNTVRITGNAEKAIGINLVDHGSLEYGYPISVVGNTVVDNDTCGSKKQVRFIPGVLHGSNTARRNGCSAP